jgi:hypothetical protein
VLIDYYAFAVVVLLWQWCLYARAYCGTAYATTVIAVAMTIARIAKSTLWFVSQKLSFRMLYLWSFRAAANNLVDIADIFDL